MRSRRLSPWLAWWMPEGLVLLAAVAFLRPGSLPSWSLPLVQAYAYLVLVGGLVVGWVVGWGRMLLVGLVLVLADQTLLLAAGSPGLARLAPLLFNLVALLLPLNLLGLSLLQEAPRRRGWRLAPLGLLLAQLLAASWLCVPSHAHWAELLEVQLIAPRWTAWTDLPQISLLTFALAVPLLAARYLLTGNRVDKGTAWGLITCFIALHGVRHGWVSTNFLATAGLILILSVYAESRRRLYVDQLTGLPSRRALDQALFDMTGRYAFAVVEIDRLKQINVDYGYAVRNEALRLVARVLARLPSPARCFRYGEASFAVLLPEKTAGEAKPLLDRARRTIEERPLTLPSRLQPLGKPAPDAKVLQPGSPLPVTVSIGLAERDDPKLKPAEVFRAAEKGLFVSKWAGGNRLKDVS